MPVFEVGGTTGRAAGKQVFPTGVDSLGAVNLSVIHKFAVAVRIDGFRRETTVAAALIKIILDGLVIIADRKIITGTV